MANSLTANHHLYAHSAILLLSVTFLLAALSIFHLAYRNAYIFTIFHHLNDLDYLPGPSKLPILRTYVFIKPCDYLLALGNVMFANITDGTAWDLSVYAFQFSGQWAGIYLLLAGEGARSGGIMGIVGALCLGLPFDCFSYGCTMPIYCISHLRYASTDRESLRVRRTDIPFLRELPKAFVLGYGVPAVLMTTLHGHPLLKQGFDAAWQAFPIWVIGLLYLFTRSGHSTQSSSNKKHASSDSTPQACSDKHETGDLVALVPLYRLGLFCCIFTQLPVLLLLIRNHVLPSTSGFTHPLLCLHAAQVFLPIPFWASKVPQIGDEGFGIAQGAKTLFQYDQIWGSVAALIWCWVLLKREETCKEEGKCRSGKETGKKGMKDWCRLAMESSIIGVLGGPVGVAIWLMWERDVMALRRGDVVERAMAKSSK